MPESEETRPTDAEVAKVGQAALHAWLVHGMEDDAWTHVGRAALEAAAALHPPREGAEGVERETTDAEPFTWPDLKEKRRYVESRSARDHWGAAELAHVDEMARWIATVDLLRDHLPDQQHNETAIRTLQSQLSTTEADLASTRRDLEAHMDAAKVREAALAESRGEVAALKEELAAERLRNPLNARAVDDPDFVLPWNLEAPHESTPRKETK